MRRLLLVLVPVWFLSTCAAPALSGPGVGDACSHTELCATGGVCDFTAAAGPVCIDADGDDDGDGIPNAIDHCPNAPGGLYDEDNDGIGDDCDKCPIAPPPATPDPDHDDVDSPCDPDPETPGDKILFFDGFQGSAIGSAWTQSDAPIWTVQGGELVAAANVADEQYLTTIVVPEPNLAIEAAYRVDELESSASTHRVGTRGLDSSPAGVATFECGVITNDAGSMEVVALETNINGTSDDARIPAFASASLYESAAYASSAMVGCTVIGDNMPVGTTQDQITPASLGTVSLGVRAVTARFEWVLVVGRGAATTGTGSGTPD